MQTFMFQKSGLKIKKHCYYDNTNNFLNFEEMILDVLSTQKSFLNTLRLSTKKLSDSELLGLVGVFEYLMATRLGI
mgnify:CR=1 FL=1